MIKDFCLGPRSILILRPVFRCGSGLDLPFAVVVVLSWRTSLLMLRLHILAGHHLGKDCLSAVFLPLVWNVLWEAGTGVILETGLPWKGQSPVYFINYCQNCHKLIYQKLVVFFLCSWNHLNLLTIRRRWVRGREKPSLPWISAEA